MPNSELLIRGAELLEADAANPKGTRFDLEMWAAPFDEKAMTLRQFTKEVDEVPVNCGTSACAMGLFAISGAFKNEGLTYRFDEILYHGTFRLIPLHAPTDRQEFHAAEELFGITLYQAAQLFDPEHYNETTSATAELEVARRMRLLAAEGELSLDEGDDPSLRDEDQDQDED